MPSESTLWDWLKQARQVLGSDLQIERIENMLTAGRPDVDVFWLGKPAVIELKICPKRPARPTTVLRFGSPLRPSQIEWARVRVAAGGTVWYLIQVGAGHQRAIYLIHHIYIEALEAGVTEAWCKEHNSLANPTPAGVILRTTTA